MIEHEAHGFHGRSTSNWIGVWQKILAVAEVARIWRLHLASRIDPRTKHFRVIGWMMPVL